jgi:Concanavalin A-like lectin/glucanases superfamily/PKD domain
MQSRHFVGFGLSRHRPLKAFIWAALFAGLCLAVSLGVANAASSELQAQWHFDAVNSGVTPDSSGNGHSLDVLEATLVPGGKFGSALDFTGAQVAKLDEATGIEPTAVTAMAWVKASHGAPGTYRYILAKGDSSCSVASYALYTGAAGGLQFYIGGAGSSATLSPAASAASVWDGQWHGVAGTYDGSAVRLYVDGVEVGSGTAATQAIDYAKTNHAITVGNYPACSGYGFVGSIDETRVYGRALSGTEISDLLTAPGPNPPQLGASLGVTPANHDFGAVTKGSSSDPVTFTVINSGGTSSGALSTSVTGTNASLFRIGSDTCTGPLAPGGSCTLAVTFNPTEVGAADATLEITGSPGGTASASLEGSAPEFPPVAAFTLKVGQAFTVQNNSKFSGKFTTWFGAGASTPTPGSSIVHYLWDFDNDGQTDLTCNSNSPAAIYQYAKAGMYAATLTTEDASGAKSTTTQAVAVHAGGKPDKPYANSNIVKSVAFCLGQLQAQQPNTEDCTHTIQFSTIEVYSDNCFTVNEGVPDYNLEEKRRDPVQGPLTGSIDPFLKTFSAKVKGPVLLNGLDVPIPPGVTSTYDTEYGAIGLGKRDIGFQFLGRQVTLAKVNLNTEIFEPDVHHLGSVGIGGIGELGGFAFDTKAELDFVAPGQTRLTLHLNLPSVFSSDAAGSGPAKFSVAITADNQSGFQLGDVHAFLKASYFGVLRVENFQVDYLAALHQWTAGAKFILDDFDASLDASPAYGSGYGIQFTNGQFSGAGAQLDLGNGEPMIAPGIFLSRLAAFFYPSPLRFCGSGTLRTAKIYNVTGTMVAVFPDLGETFPVPPSGDCGFPSLNGTVLNRTSLIGGGQIAIDVLGAFDLPLGDAFVLYSYPDRLQFGGKVNVPLGVFRVTGSASGFFDGANGRFNVEGEGAYEVPIFGKLLGSMLASSDGIAGCAGAEGPFGIGKVVAGFGYHWGSGFPPEFYPWGCNVAPYRVYLSARQSARLATRQLSTDTSFNLPAGLPFVDLKLIGSGGAPDVTLHGPNGETYSTAGQLGGGADPFLFLRDDEYSVAYVGVKKPAAGEWTVTANEGSPPLSSVSGAYGLDPPKVKASISGEGSKRTLEYEITPQPGLSVRFAERGDGVYREIGAAHGDKGKIVFKPTIDAGNERTIVAIVQHDGLTTEMLDVAKFKAPPPPKMTPPKGLEIRRKGEHVKVRFNPVHGADTYSVTATTSDGFPRLVIADKPKAKFGDVSPALAGKVSVIAVAANGDIGKPAVRRFKQAR